MIYENIMQKCVLENCILNAAYIPWNLVSGGSCINTSSFFLLNYPDPGAAIGQRSSNNLGPGCYSLWQGLHVFQYFVPLLQGSLGSCLLEERIHFGYTVDLSRSLFSKATS